MRGVDKWLIKWLVWLMIVGLATACSAGGRSTSEVPVVRLMTHDSFDMSAELIAAFEAETGIKVEVFKAGDGGEMLNKTILAKDSPLADVLFGVDNTFLSRALENDIFLAYKSPLLGDVNDALELDPQYRVSPVDFGDICLNYDVAWFERAGVPPPDSLQDLADPAYDGLTVVENAATSTPGLGFLLATIETFGEDGYLDYWQQLVANDVLVVDGWEQAYYSYFTAASEGDRPIVVSYATSPVAEVYFAEETLATAPTAAVLTDGTCFRQIEFIGILKGTPVEEQARQLVDFLLDQAFQEDIPLKMFVFPANETAQLPEVFQEYGHAANRPAQMTPERIAANREAWIQAWTNVVLR